MHKNYLLLFLLLSLNFCAFAQPSVLYSSINTTPRVALTNMGLFLQGRMQANQSGYQRWAFHRGTVASPDYSQNWRIGSTPNVLSFSNFLQAGYANGANYFTGGGGVDGELNSAVIGNYYTFNVTKNASASNDMEVIETSYNPTIISTVTQSPLAASVVANTAVAVTITMASAPAADENVFLRYSIDGFANSFLIQAAFTGNTSTVNIPCQAAGTTVSYYVFSSTETIAGINSDLASFGVNSYDMATLNLNNNGGPNYSYTVAAAPTNIISYPGSPYCSNAGTATVTNTGTLGGVYSSTAGLSINASTGAINLAASTPGTYTVTYSIAAAGSCSLFNATTLVTINAATAATISYSGSPYCSNVASALVTRTGTTGGTYSSTAGLSINATTGEINISTSIAGIYTVTYTVAAAGGCAAYTTTSAITITAAPTATISYGTLPYCSNSGNATAIRTGTIGGIYSSSTGLLINPTTGIVNLSTSTAGTYTVTYTIAAASGCTVFSTTAPITITAAPSATISYAGSPYCSSSALALVTRVGTSGGTYSSTSGLNINALTGEINISTSTPGIYTVNYTVAAAGGCAAFTTTANITITAAPNATINYIASQYCNIAGTATVTRTGVGAGGTYSSTTGLVINATTGDVNTLTSAPGTYTVTYSIAAIGGCNVYTTTTSITINSLSTAPTGATASATLICASSSTVTLTVVGGTLGSGASYKWYSGSCGGTLVGTGAMLTNLPITTTTTYFVRIEGTCNSTTCASVTVTLAPQPIINIISTPTAGFTPNAPIIITATVTPTDNYTYTWTKNNANVITTPANTNAIKVYAADAGNYKLTVTALSGCVAKTENIFTASIPNPDVLFIFPNPNTGLFNVAYSNGQPNLNGRNISVYDEKGARVFTQTYNNLVPYSNMKVDMRGYASGLYFVVLRDYTGKELASGKVLVF